MDEPTLRMVEVDPNVPHNFVILDPIEPGQTPEYCLHGKATCMACGDWVWLGHATAQAVIGGEALPMCLNCAMKHFPDHAPVRRFEDHRRADGPHE